MTSSRLPRCAIIGAGLAGVTLARQLEGLARIRIYEKSRGVSGRMSTHRHEIFSFDHGAQYFTAIGADFRRLLAPYQAARIIRPWATDFATMAPDGQLSPRAMTATPWVACPGMTGLVKAMAAGLDIRHQVTVSEIAQKDGHWQLRDADNNLVGAAEWVITALPAPQARLLLLPEFSGQAALEKVRMLGCFTLMLGFEQPPSLPFGACFVEDQPVGFIADNGTKPGGQRAGGLTVQARNAWAETQIETPELAEEEMAAWLDATFGIKAEGAAYRRFHRWRYASVDAPLGAPFLVDEARGLAAIGDWCIRGRVEAAHTSAMALAARLAASLG